MEKPVNKSSLPKKGLPSDTILGQLHQMQRSDVDWKSGRNWSTVYHLDEVHDRLLKEAYGQYFSTNYLNPFAFKSLQKMESEVVAMTAGMLHGGPATVGTMSSGGTESILLAVYTCREWARENHSGIKSPEIVVPQTIHPAFDKAAHLFGLSVRKAPVDENRRAIPKKMEALINKNTIMLAASAPSYPNGILDPIPEIGALAEKHHLPFHVDSCIGGFMLPWVERPGAQLHPWDFQVPGVTSMSADVHKFGYGAKGASVVLYRSMDFLKHQFFISTGFPGGIYASATLAGTRPGGAIAAAWAGMKHLGEEGYLAIAKKLMEATRQLRQGMEEIPEISIVGEPCMNILSYTTRGNHPDIFVVADFLEEKGWMVDRQQNPDSVHLTVMPTNVPVIGWYLEDLKAAVAHAKAHPEAAARGNAALYGLMARIPFRGMVERNVRQILVNMYGTSTGGTDEREVSSPIAEGPKWMGWLNRILACLRKGRG
ncbi:MAG: aspartate aminotransferase family protein [Saprospiraceae bacterium]|nr:MAG: aspartate aminotransferase family protein [Saprospiraceae bacterium]